MGQTLTVSESGKRVWMVLATTCFQEPWGSIDEVRNTMEGASQVWLGWRRCGKELDKEWTSILLVEWSFATNGIFRCYKKARSLHTWENDKERNS